MPKRPTTAGRTTVPAVDLTAEVDTYDVAGAPSTPSRTASPTRRTTAGADRPDATPVRGLSHRFGVRLVSVSTDDNQQAGQRRTSTGGAERAGATGQVTSGAGERVSGRRLRNAGSCSWAGGP